MVAVQACQIGFVWKAEPYLQRKKHCYLDCGKQWMGMIFRF